MRMDLGVEVTAIIKINIPGKTLLARKSVFLFTTINLGVEYIGL